MCPPKAATIDVLELLQNSISVNARTELCIGGVTGETLVLAKINFPLK